MEYTWTYDFGDHIVIIYIAKTLSEKIQLSTTQFGVIYKILNDSLSLFEQQYHNDHFIKP